MANAKICDRCGTYYKPTAKSGMCNVGDNSGYTEKSYDLCDACKLLLDDFLKSGKPVAKK